MQEMEWKVLGNGKRLLIYQKELVDNGVELPSNLFVIGCGGCELCGRALINQEGVELFRETWGQSDPEYDRGLEVFYGRVSTPG